MTTHDSRDDVTASRTDLDQDPAADRPAGAFDTDRPDVDRSESSGFDGSTDLDRSADDDRLTDVDSAGSGRSTEKDGVLDADGTYEPVTPAPTPAPTSARPLGSSTGDDLPGTGPAFATPDSRPDSRPDSVDSVDSDEDSDVDADLEAGSEPDAAPVPLPATAATSSDAGAGTGEDDAAREWQELQGRFVDDPQAAVRSAGDLVERSLAELRSRLDEGSTEELRTAFRRYRELHASLAG